MCFVLPQLEFELFSTTTILLLIALSIVGFLLFWVLDRRRKDPYFHPGLLGAPVVLSAVLIRFLGEAAVHRTLFCSAFMLQSDLGYTVIWTGIIMSPLGLGVAITSLGGGTLFSRFHVLHRLAAGLALEGLAMATVSIGHVGPVAFWTAVAGFFLLGLGSGLIAAPTKSMAISGVDKSLAARASSLVSIGARLGATLGITTGTLILSVFLPPFMRRELNRRNLLVDEDFVPAVSKFVVELSPDEAIKKVGHETSVAFREAVFDSFALAMDATSAVFAVMLFLAAAGCLVFARRHRF